MLAPTLAKGDLTSGKTGARRRIAGDNKCWLAGWLAWQLCKEEGVKLLCLWAFDAREKRCQEERERERKQLFPLFAPIELFSLPPPPLLLLRAVWPPTCELDERNYRFISRPVGVCVCLY